MVDTMKKLAAAFAAACALCLALAGTAFADATPEVGLEPVDGTDEVAVSLEGLQGASALRLTLAVTGATDARFEFDDALGAKVEDARYLNGRLNVYVAGAAGLLDGPVPLGRALVSGDEGAAVKVEVAALSIVDASHAEAEVAELNASAPVEVVVGGAATPPEPPSGGGEEGGDPSGDPGVDPSANRSPGAPSGTDQSLESTGDPLAAAPAALALAGLAAAAALALARRRSLS